MSSTGALLARYGGEELVVMLPDTGAQGAMEVAQAIRRNIAQRRIAHRDSPVSDLVTVSIGAATMTPDSENRPEKLIAAADQALYAAKEGGRERICVA